MFILKVVHAANRVYRGVLSVALKSVNATDKRNLKTYSNKLQNAEDMRAAARRMTQSARDLENTTHETYAVQSREVNAAYNFIANLRDDATIKQ